ncbi:hypothetical protein [Rhizobium sp. BK251]|nr:hypothetical protein [Rhizobium sp. BK251]TCL69875.1 hypothetical protein EV286_108453 [Rhizobium sp. BK251]
MKKSMTTAGTATLFLGRPTADARTRDDMVTTKRGGARQRER